MISSQSGTVREISLPQIRDARGDLTFVEGMEHIPFSIARVYYLYNVPAEAERAATRTRNSNRSSSRCRAVSESRFPMASTPKNTGCVILPRACTSID